MTDCMLHAKGCDGRSPCSVELDVRVAVVEAGPTQPIRRQRESHGRGMSAYQKAALVRRMRAEGRWSR